MPLQRRRSIVFPDLPELTFRRLPIADALLTISATR
jgi:hypothetical protein